MNSDRYGNHLRRRHLSPRNGQAAQLEDVADEQTLGSAIPFAEWVQRVNSPK